MRVIVYRKTKTKSEKWNMLSTVKHDRWWRSEAYSSLKKALTPLQLPECHKSISPKPRSQLNHVFFLLKKGKNPIKHHLIGKKATWGGVTIRDKKAKYSDTVRIDSYFIPWSFLNAFLTMLKLPWIKLSSCSTTWGLRMHSTFSLLVVRGDEKG